MHPEAQRGCTAHPQERVVEVHGGVGAEVRVTRHGSLAEGAVARGRGEAGEERERRQARDLERNSHGPEISPGVGVGPLSERTNFDAVVVGAGFAGVYMLHRLCGLGLSAGSSRPVTASAGPCAGSATAHNRYFALEWSIARRKLRQVDLLAHRAPGECRPTHSLNGQDGGGRAQVDLLLPRDFTDALVGATHALLELRVHIRRSRDF